MRFFLDLDDVETQQWRDACNWYKENPSEPPRKFALQQKSRERIVQIGNQLGIDVYPGAPPGPDPGPAPSLPFHEVPAWTEGTNPVYLAQADSVIAIPYQTGAGPYSVSDVLRGVAAEFTSQPAIFMAAINPTPGDMTGYESGTEVGPIVNVTADGKIKPGTRAFFNICVAPGHPPTKFRFSFPNVPH